MASRDMQYRLYNFQIIEQFGDLKVELSQDNLFLDLRSPDEYETDRTQPLKFWKDLCVRHKHPYVLAVGHIKPEILDSHKQKQSNKLEASSANGDKYKKKPFNGGARTVYGFFRDLSDTKSYQK